MGSTPQEGGFCHICWRGEAAARLLPAVHLNELVCHMLQLAASDRCGEVGLPRAVGGLRPQLGCCLLAVLQCSLSGSCHFIASFVSAPGSSPAPAEHATA